MTVHNLVSLLGIPVFVALAWLMSADRRRMNWRAIFWGTALQLAFGFLVFQVPAGRRLFVLLNDLVVRVLDSASAGARFVFGRLALPPGASDPALGESLGFFLAFQAFPTIVFFSALMAILYFWKIMPVIIQGFAWLFTRLMRISGAESLCAASNIFVGIESSFTVRPYLEKMTRSELCTVLTAGMATVASNVLGVYVFYLRPSFPNIAGHLISASILSAPAAVVMAKAICPETETPETLGRSVKPAYERENSLFEAVIHGAQGGLQLILGIVALLLAVLGLMALVDMILVGVGWRVNHLVGWQVDWSLKGLLGYLFRPLTFLMGVPLSDVSILARIIGERTVVTEIPGYQDLTAAFQAGRIEWRSMVIGSYALCGFAHFASLAIFAGGISALVPSRARDLARVGLRALIAATLACLMTGCIAGLWSYGDPATVLGVALPTGPE